MVKKRCIRCRQHVRDDGTCQNQKCVLYVPETTKDTTTETTETAKSK